mgnify:FL=1
MLGLITSFFAKESENFLERNLMRIGIGLSFFIVIGLLLNLLHIPLGWRVFILIGIIICSIYVLRNKESLKIWVKKPSLKIQERI